MPAAQQLATQVGIAAACRALGLSRATFYRRQKPAAPSENACCPSTVRIRRSPRALSAEEQRAVLEVLHEPRFVDRAPAAIYAQLLDENRYFCSTRTMYRLLAANGEVRERRDQLRRPQYAKPELLATGPNQVWSWDITKLRGPVKCVYYHLYAILDIFSRYVVGWMVAARESEELARRLILDTCDKQNINSNQLILHSDRGPSMKSHAVAQLLATLGVSKSHSRPHVSNDNPFSESHFKTLKYHSDFPDRFTSQDHARDFCRVFFPWYNDEHFHSGLALLTPASLHYGQTSQILAQRQATLTAAYALHPERFVRHSPQVSQPPSAVWINPPLAPNHTAEPVH